MAFTETGRFGWSAGSLQSGQHALVFGWWPPKCSPRSTDRMKQIAGPLACVAITVALAACNGDDEPELTRPADPLDGEALPAIPLPPIDDAVARRLARSNGELTSWDLHQALTECVLQRRVDAIGL